jgi:hypothetical protein
MFYCLSYCPSLEGEQVITLGREACDGERRRKKKGGWVKRKRQ